MSTESAAVDRPRRESPREPYCIHSGGDSVLQPASWCLICKDAGPFTRWVAYWTWVRENAPDEIPSGR